MIIYLTCRKFFTKNNFFLRILLEEIVEQSQILMEMDRMTLILFLIMQKMRKKVVWEMEDQPKVHLISKHCMKNLNF